MTLTEAEFKSIAEDVMTDLPFVQWDRGREWIHENRKCMSIYGWIEREKDDYKDFVLIGIYENKDTRDAKLEFLGTSSAKYSSKIHEILFPDADENEHNECFRLEDRFDAENIIRKSKQVKLGQTS